MNRRKYISLTAATALPLAGCTGSSDENTSGSTTNPQTSTVPETTVETTTADPTTIETTTATVSDYDVSEVKSNAKVISYEDLFRDIENHVGDYIYYEQAGINQVIEQDGQFLFRLFVPDGNSYSDIFGG
ncbi:MULTISPECIES: hypothetical protein [Halorussus]|uniref:hypothetical protein n=1 Tax=Halorussus TaxID=1070314 RepID=UPI0020A201E8|nr:hypothetical protein [Halorussus vallis]USZ75687.1 hypothetical protein NGM07_19940 [Halorussus vallis]USZ75762.1 hypothetical protein NGM07_00175 [Halorussus vallis]